MATEHEIDRMLVRLVGDTGDYSRKMEQAAQTTATQGRRIEQAAAPAERAVKQIAPAAQQSSVQLSQLGSVVSVVASQAGPAGAAISAVFTGLTSGGALIAGVTAAVAVLADLNSHLRETSPAARAAAQALRDLNRERSRFEAGLRAEMGEVVARAAESRDPARIQQEIESVESAIRTNRRALDQAEASLRNLQGGVGGWFSAQASRIAGGVFGHTDQFARRLASLNREVEQGNANLGIFEDGLQALRDALQRLGNDQSMAAVAAVSETLTARLRENAAAAETLTREFRTPFQVFQERIEELQRLGPLIDAGTLTRAVDAAEEQLRRATGGIDQVTAAADRARNSLQAFGQAMRGTAVLARSAEALTRVRTQAMALTVQARMPALPAQRPAGPTPLTRQEQSVVADLLRQIRDALQRRDTIEIRGANLRR